MKQPKIPFKLITEESGNAVTVYLYGVIGQRPSYWEMDGDKSEDITDMEFLKMVRKFEKEEKTRLDVRINSPGGSTVHLDGIVAQIQTTSMEVHTWVDGIAASAAADIWLAAPKENRHMAKNAKLMIHGPIDGCYGNAKAMEQCAEKLRKFEDAYVAQMAADTGKKEEEESSRFYDGNDHWLTAKDCVEEGLISEVEDYETEKMPKDPEKLAAAALFDFFDGKKEEQAIGIFKKLHDLAFPKKALNISPKNEEEMDIENIKKALKSGEIKEADLLKALNAEKTATPAPVTPTPPVAPTPVPEKTMAEQITEAVAAAVDPLKKQIEEQADEIQKLGDKPGDKPTVVPSPGDVTDDDDTGFEALKSLNADLDAAAKKGEAIKVGGYGTGAPRK